MVCHFFLLILQVDGTQLCYHNLFRIKLVEPFGWPNEGTTELTYDTNGRFFYSMVRLFIGLIVMGEVVN